MSRRKPNPELIDEDNPELTDEWFARARPAAEVLREQFGAEAVAHLLKPRRGRPPKASRKRATNIRLSPEVLEYFRATGPGWQTRVDEILKSHVARRARRAPASGRSARRAARA
jgi:uncharacterized protein (DUF4415 family)